MEERCSGIFLSSIFLSVIGFRLNTLASEWQLVCSLPLSPDHALPTMFVNGIPSTSSIVNLTVPIPTATALTNLTRLTNGSFQFAFTNAPGVVFGMLVSSNSSLPLSNWTTLGRVTEISPGQFQFTDPQAATNAQRFYRLRSP